MWLRGMVLASLSSITWVSEHPMVMPPALMGKHLLGKYCTMGAISYNHAVSSAWT